MTPASIHHAASLLRQHALARSRMASLPASSQPADRAQGYAIQAAVAVLHGAPRVAWKIAATSTAGQAHIGVDGPLGGPYLQDRVLAPGAAVPLAGNAMNVAEVEFAFRMGADLPPRAEPYSLAETMAAVSALHPAIEIPDSRYQDFVRVGAPALIADAACSGWLVIGPPAPETWRSLDLAAHTVSAAIDGQTVAQGSGAAALGDPRVALTWLANELRVHGPGLTKGEWVSTGTCVVPVPVREGITFAADYGQVGQLSITLV